MDIATTRSRQPPSLKSLWSIAVYALAITLTVGLSSCTIKKEGFKTDQHIVMVDGAGDLIDPRSNVPLADPNRGQHIPFWPYPPQPNPTAYAEHLLDSMGNRFSDIQKDGTPCKTEGAQSRKRIVLFIHGGMNTARDSIKRATDYSDMILADCTYPIFINWDSSLTSSYLDHLITLRQGRVAADWCCGAWKELGDGNWRHAGAKAAGYAATIVTTPVYLALDLMRGAIRFPVDIYGVYAEMLSTKWRGDRIAQAEQPSSWSWPDESCTKDHHIGITPRADQLLCESWYHSPRAYSIAQGFNERSTVETRSQIGFAVLTFPVHMASGFIIDATGTGAWSAMYRRTTAMFHRDDDLWSKDSHRKSTGGIASFMTAFRTFLDHHDGKDQWEVVIVGHSMGTIVVNEMVRQFGHPLESDPHHRPLFDKIIYMAAACSLRDYLNTIPHYLEEYQYEQDGETSPKMYHLMLQDHAEAAEQYGGISLPGSLLVWIDGFFARPDSPLDLVAGRYQNLLRIVHLHDTPSIRSRVSFKAFHSGNRTVETNPQTHGDFGNFPFWKEEFWRVTGEDPFSLRRLLSN